MIKKENNVKSIAVIIFIFVLLNVILCEFECEREYPIKIGTECLSTYCSDSQFEAVECIKSNSIIKTQWLNNIILVGEYHYRYTNFITSENGKTIFHSTPYPCSGERIYFGIDSMGNPIFKDSDDNNVYFYKKKVIEDEYKKYVSFEDIAGLIKINGDSNHNKQYYISIAKPRTNTEIQYFTLLFLYPKIKNR